MRDEGGPAFPSPEVRSFDGMGVAPQHYGMSLRDYFAAAALTGIVQSDHFGEALQRKWDWDKTLAEAGIKNESPQVYMARIVYSLADAMLAARVTAPSGGVGGQGKGGECG